MNVYEVTVIGFDEFENRTPRYVSARKLFSSKAKATRWISKHKKENKPYRGYDRECYPLYKIKEKQID